MLFSHFCSSPLYVVPTITYCALTKLCSHLLFPLFWTLLPPVASSLCHFSLSFSPFSLNRAVALGFPKSNGCYWQMICFKQRGLFCSTKAGGKSGQRLGEPHNRDLVGLRPNDVAPNMETWLLNYAQKINVIIAWAKTANVSITWLGDILETLIWGRCTSMCISLLVQYVLGDTPPYLLLLPSNSVGLWPINGRGGRCYTEQPRENLA